MPEISGSPDKVDQLKAAIDVNDLTCVQTLMSGNVDLHRAPLGYSQNGPLTWAAECRGVPASPERLAIAQWMLENGSDVHQGGDGPLMRASLSDARIPMMELLVEFGADVNALWNGDYPILFAPCETLQPQALQWLIAHGANPQVVSADSNNCVAMLVGTYARNPQGKRACLEVFAAAEVAFPDTAPMAIHRGRVDLLKQLLQKNQGILKQRLTLSEIFPAELGIQPPGGLHCAPLEGGTLLHLAVEYHEAEVAQWLIDHGADVNARSAVDADGFGGQTPLFHTTITLGAKTDTLARLLLANGADPNPRTMLRKQLRDTGDPKTEQMYEFHDVTPIGFARQFQEPRFVNEAAIAALAEFGGK